MEQRRVVAAPPPLLGEGRTSWWRSKKARTLSLPLLTLDSVVGKRKWDGERKGGERG
jgi:hypothetical protein